MLPEIPPSWTPFHSIALLLIGASAIDGEIADIEVQEILLKLVEYDALNSHSAKVVLGEAHQYFQIVLQREALFDALGVHAHVLAENFPRQTLRAILADVAAVVGADGRLDPAEERYFNALKSDWGL